MRCAPHAVALAALLTLAAGEHLPAAPPGEEALALRNQGVAQLENEQPARAEEIFRRLVAAVPADPLPHANLAIALLRQQKFDEARQAIGRALERAPARPDLLSIQAEVEQWAGDPGRALALAREAARRAPDDPRIQYSLFRAADTAPGAEAEKARSESLERLAALRPDNLVVILQRALAAREAGDRATASAAFLRLRELAWQAPEAAGRLLDRVLEALEAGDLDAARVPALQLGNLLKVTPMHRESQRELSLGIQGTPVTRFVDEPAPAAFGDPVPLRFRGERLSDVPTVGAALAAADLDGDGSPELARLVDSGGASRLEVRGDAGDLTAAVTLPGPAHDRLLAADLTNDGALDLLAYGPGGVRFWRGSADGDLTEATASLGLGGARGAAAAAIDFDIEGDLDLALAGDGGVEVWLNRLDGELLPVGERLFGGLELPALVDLAATDLDRDGDLDLLGAHAGGVVWLDNLRQGEFADRTAAAGLDVAPAARAVASGDFDNDGWPDVVVAGDGLAFFRNLGDGRFTPWEPGGRLGGGARLDDLVVLDVDNDGRLDLALAAERALVVMSQRPQGGFAFLNVDGGPAGARALAAADLDGDGDLDLAAAGPEGLWSLTNEGGNANRWLSVRLRGLEKGNSKNNVLGLGATLEVFAGDAYLFREVQDAVTHLGLGRIAEPDLLRVVWTNGVPQSRLAPATRQTIVEEQVLKGSCPFLYAWDGERVRFVTDLLWGSPAGLPVAPGVWAGADPREIVHVEGAAARDGVYDLRITEELWEAAFFDRVRLWVVDHPAEVEVASSLRIVPGREVPERVHGTRELRPLARATDAAGRDVTARVAARDEIYADGWRRSPYQGAAEETWSFVMDLGEAPGRPVRLHLDGWIFPSDASLNLALAQRGYRPVGPRLEVETAQGWETLLPETGFPA
ncbi:MAG: FG-GAP-like repeat-containing protein, partial [Thermoanaerobaculia bacterium]|nr:FG-GAP-like repeat-containing protein [Thermoanaerobaculia bacterium]